MNYDRQINFIELYRRKQNRKRIIHWLEGARIDLGAFLTVLGGFAAAILFITTAWLLGAK